MHRLCETVSNGLFKDAPEPEAMSDSGKGSSGVSGETKSLILKIALGVVIVAALIGIGYLIYYLVYQKQQGGAALHSFTTPSASLTEDAGVGIKQNASNVFGNGKSGLLPADTPFNMIHRRPSADN